MTPKQEEFVRQYLVDLNATQAAIRSGYSRKTAHQAGAENLRKPEVANAIQEAMNERSERTGIKADRVLQEYSRIAFADIREIVSVTKDGVRIEPSDTWRKQAAAAVSEIKEDKDGNISLKMHSKLGALDKIAQHLGMLIDHKSVTVKRLTEMTDDELRFVAGVEENADATRH